MKSGNMGLKRLMYWHQGIAGKTIATILLTMHFATIHFSQKYGQSQATGSGEMNMVMTDETVLPISRRRKDAKLLLQQVD